MRGPLPESFEDGGVQNAELETGIGPGKRVEGKLGVEQPAESAEQEVLPCLDLGSVLETTHFQFGV